MSDVTAVTGSSSTQSSYDTAASNSLLGKDAFLQILVTELANQDPLEPLDQSEFITQMAQFSQVEQIANIEDNLESLGQFMKFSSSSIIGSDITYADPEDESVRTGTVQSVIFDADNIMVKTGDGVEISLDRITAFGQ